MSAKLTVPVLVTATSVLQQLTAMNSNGGSRVATWRCGTVTSENEVHQGWGRVTIWVRSKLISLLCIVLRKCDVVLSGTANRG